MNQLPSITPTQHKILLYLYRFRFLNRIQIQQLLHHKDYKTVNLWLKDLTAKTYISRIYHTSFPENTKPAIYFLAAISIKLLRAEHVYPEQTLRNLYRESSRSKDFIAHSQLIANLYLDLESRQEGYVTHVSRDYAAIIGSDALAELAPDMYVSQLGKGKARSFFVELLGDAPAARLNKRIRAYCDSFQYGEWAEETGTPFPTVCLVCRTSRVLGHTAQYARKLVREIEDSDLKIRITSWEKAATSGLAGKIWEEIS